MNRSLTTGALAAALFAPALASAQDTSADLAEMRAELAAMRAEIAQLKGETPAAQSSADLRAATDAALDDAMRRVNYQTEELSAGHDGKKFFLESADGAFRMNIGGQLQGRYIYNNRTNAPGTGIDDGDNLAGFQLRRAKLKFTGNIADPKITYGVTLASNRDSNNTFLEVASLGYKFDNGVKVEGGRFKAPFAFDELTSSSRQQAAERSLVNEQFSIGYTEGVQVSGSPVDNLGLTLMINDGAGAGESGNGDFNETPVDIAVTVRGDYLVMGEDKSFAKDYVSWSGDEASLQIGGAFHHEQVKSGVDAAAGTLDAFQRFTLDALYNNAGVSAAAAVFFESQDAVAGTAERDPFGFLIQGGYNIDDTWEPFARYEFIDLDTAGAAEGEINVLTVGVNYYLKKHAAKFTVDGVIVLDPLDNGALSVSDGLGLQGDGAGEDGQFALRAQFQLLF